MFLLWRGCNLDCFQLFYRFSQSLSGEASCICQSQQHVNNIGVVGFYLKQNVYTVCSVYNQSMHQNKNLLILHMKLGRILRMEAK